MMKIIILFLGLNTMLFSHYLRAQTQNISHNRNGVGLEHNMLFNATSRFTVTQSGSATLKLEALFDGRFNANYSSSALTPSDPTIIMIEDLKFSHTQRGAWVGWSTRGWPATSFKIEGYNEWQGANPNTWVELANVVDYNNTYFITEISKPGGIYTKLRFTFFDSNGTNDRFGITELFYIHPEAVSPYEGLLGSAKLNFWTESGEDLIPSQQNIIVPKEISAGSGRVNISNEGPEGRITGAIERLSFRTSNTDKSEYLSRIVLTKGDISDIRIQNANLRLDNELFYTNYLENKIGIGTDQPDHLLTVNGTIHSKEVVIDLEGALAPDYVFDSTYDLKSLEEVDDYIQKNNHLPNIPSAVEMEENGINLKEMNLKLLEKIEELTLHMIEMNNHVKTLENKVQQLERAKK